jgi:hypothetical protein
MIKFLHFFLTSLLLCQNIHKISTLSPSEIVSEPVGPPSAKEKCPNGLATACNLQCKDDNYALDAKGCPKCACASEKLPSKTCPLYKCRDDCGKAGYKIDKNGCRTCECAKLNTECSGPMCRMYCVHGFRRDEKGCEICQCNDSPQPCPQLNCANACLNGYEKDYSGCSTCQCKVEETDLIKPDNCSPMKCNLNCPYGFETDPSGCSLCSCNRCPLRTCRIFCTYGFKKNSDGCDICECDLTPIAENIACSERIPCDGNRVCNLNLNLCELVSADKVNWFVYNFDIKTGLFNDKKFVNIFKSG